MSAERPALRLAKPDDVAAIMELEDATFPDDAWSAATMSAEVASEHGHYLVAETADRELAGYAGLLAPRGTGQGDVQTIAVAPAFRGQGLGRTLLRALLAEAVSRNASEVFLEVRDDNPIAQRLYESEGFDRIAVRPRYYPGGVDAIIMRATLAVAAAAPGGAGS